MSLILEKLLASQEAAQEAASRAYNRLVRTLAADEDDGVGLEDVTKVLEAAEKSVDDLNYDVSRRKRYDKLQAELKACRDAVAEKPDLKAKIDAATAVLQAAEQQYRETIHPWRVRLQEITNRVAIAADLGLQLQEMKYTPGDEG